MLSTVFYKTLMGSWVTFSQLLTKLLSLFDWLFNTWPILLLVTPTFYQPKNDQSRKHFFMIYSPEIDSIHGTFFLIWKSERMKSSKETSITIKGAVLNGAHHRKSKKLQFSMNFEICALSQVYNSDTACKFQVWWGVDWNVSSFNPSKFLTAKIYCEKVILQ